MVKFFNTKFVLQIVNELFKLYLKNGLFNIKLNNIKKVKQKLIRKIQSTEQN